MILSEWADGMILLTSRGIPTLLGWSPRWRKNHSSRGAWCAGCLIIGFCRWPVRVAALRVTLRNSEPRAAAQVESLLWSPSWPQSRTFCMLRINLSSHPLSLVGEPGWRTGHMYCNHFLSHLLEKPLQDSGLVYFPEASWGWTSLRRGETCSSG